MGRRACGSGVKPRGGHGQRRRMIEHGSLMPGASEKLEPAFNASSDEGIVEGSCRAEARQQADPARHGAGFAVLPRWKVI